MTDELRQNIVIYQQNGTTFARGAVDQRLLAEGSASAAIQRALDAAGSTGGAEVIISPGNYRLESPLRVPSRTTLRGSGRGSRLDCACTEAEPLGVLAKGVQGACVRDLAVYATSRSQFAGVVLDDAGDSQIFDIYAQGFGGHGVVVRNNSFLCEVRGCKLANNAISGLLMSELTQGGRVGDFLPNLVSNCIAYGGGHGFMAHHCIVTNFVGCQAFQVNQCGFRIQAVSNSVLISGCRTFKIIGDAVSVDASHEFNASSNIFCWHRGRGIVLNDVSWGTISGNEIIDSGSEMTGGDAAIGVLLSGFTRGIQITGNAIFNWGGQGLMTYGVKEEATCSNNAIVANNFNWWDRADILAEGQGTQVANNTGQKSPAYHGTPDGPDPRFSLDAMMAFIQES